MAAHLGLATRSDLATEQSEPAARDATSGVGLERLIRVALADDSASALRSLRLLLDGQPGINVLAEPAAPAEPAGSRVEPDGKLPDVLVLILNAPGTASLALLRDLHMRAAGVRIVVVAADSSPAFARQALHGGASGYVLIERAGRELIEAVQRAAAGVEFLSPRIAAALDGQRAVSSEDVLSPRETEVLRLTALGFTGAEIAQQLELSRRTVESHRATIHRKLGLATRAELVDYALRRRLVGA
jgi:DNA-binding NarL/FixJ family response regulator